MLTQEKIDEARLPQPINQFWLSLINESHPLVQLYWLKDLYELVVRWCVTLALAYHRAVSQGDFPEHLRDELGSLIERPTLGQWRYILSRLLEGAEMDAHALNRLRATQDRLNDASPAGGSYDTSLIALRNLLAHGGGLGPEESTALLHAHLPKMVAILVSISELPSTVLAQVDNETRVLAGKADEVTRIDTPDQRDSAWLLTKEGLIGLAPLFHFRRPTCIGGDGQLRELSQAPCSQVFMRLDQKQQTFTPVGASRPVVHDLDRDLLRERFGKQKVTQDDTPKVRTFLDDAYGMSEELIGRLKERESLSSWLTSQTSWGTQRRLAWISSGPGMGKSMLMSWLAVEIHESYKLNGGGASKRALYVHRFRGGDARNNRRSFLQGLLKTLCTWPKTKELCSESALEGLNIDDLWATLESVKKHLESQKPTRPEALLGKTPMLFIIADGLDEIALHDPDFAQDLTSLAGPCVTVIAAGRPEFGVDQVMRVAEADEPISGGLSPMTGSDMRAMLISGLGAQRGELISRDTWDGDQVHNAFVNRVVERADGMPLYVKLVLQDLSEGVFSISDEDQLPQGLTAYYQQLIQRLGLNTVQRDLPFIVAAIATAEEPLTDQALASLMSLPWEEDRHHYVPRVEAALRVGAGLLRSAPTPEGHSGWGLYHQSFREFIIGRERSEGVAELPPCPALQDTLKEVRRLFCRGAHYYKELGYSDLGRHLQRWGTEYLIWWAPNGHAQAGQRLCDPVLTEMRLRQVSPDDLTDWVEEFHKVDSSVLDALQPHFQDWSLFSKTSYGALRRASLRQSRGERFLQLALEHASENAVTRSVEEALNQGRLKPPPAYSRSRPQSLSNSTILSIIDYEDYVDHNPDIIITEGLMIISSHVLTIWDLQTGALLQNLPCHYMEQLSSDRLLLDQSEILALDQMRVIAKDDFSRLDGAVFGYKDHLVSYTERGLKLTSIHTGEAVTTIVGNFSVKAGIQHSGRYVVIGGYKQELFIWDALTQTMLGSVSDPQLSSRTIYDVRDHSSGDILITRGFGTQGVTIARLNPQTLGVVASKDLPARCEVISFKENIICVEEYPKRAYFHLSILNEDDLAIKQEYSIPCLPDTHSEGNFYLDTIVHQSPDRVVICTSNTIVIVTETKQFLSTLPSLTIDAPGRAMYVYEDQCVVHCKGYLYHLDLTTFTEHSLPFNGGENKVIHTGDWIDFFGECYQSFSFQEKRIIDHQYGKLSAGRQCRIGDTILIHNDKKRHVFMSSFGDHLPSDPISIHKYSAKYVTLTDRLIISYSKDPHIGVWDMQARSLLHTLEGHQGKVLGVHWIQTFNRLISWSEDLTVRLWDLHTGQALAVYRGEGCQLDEFTKFEQLESGHLITLGEDGTIRCWEADGKARTILTGMQAVDHFTQLPDHSLVTWQGDRWRGNLDQRVIRWALVENADQVVQSGHSASIIGVQINGDQCLSWGEDGRIIRWSIRSGQELGLCYQHTAMINHLTLLDPSHVLFCDDKHRNFYVCTLGESGEYVLEQSFRYNKPPAEYAHHVTQVRSEVEHFDVAPRSRVDEYWRPSVDIRLTGAPNSRGYGYTVIDVGEGRYLSFTGWSDDEQYSKQFIVWCTQPGQEHSKILFIGSLEELALSKPELLQFNTEDCELKHDSNLPKVGFGHIAVPTDYGALVRLASGEAIEWHSLSPSSLHYMGQDFIVVSVGSELKIIHLTI